MTRRRAPAASRRQLQYPDSHRDYVWRGDPGDAVREHDAAERVAARRERLRRERDREDVDGD